MSLYFSDISDRKFNTWCSHTQRLDTYGCGCQHDCIYCYAQGLLNFRGLWNNPAPKMATLYQIKKTISKLSKNKVIKLGGMSDCFMPMEIANKVTYNTIKILNYYKIHYLIVTKSHLVANAEYLKIYDKSLAHFQITITSTDKMISSKIEKASTPEMRINAIEKLQELGFDVSVRLSPYISQYIDLNVLNSIKCNKVLIEFLKVNHWVKKSFDINYSKYTLKYGGYEHLELEEKINQAERITGFKEKSIGEYVKDHHEYFKKYVNFNVFDCCNLNFIPKKTNLYKQLTLNF
jgi:DNA repair photolyase